MNLDPIIDEAIQHGLIFRGGALVSAEDNLAETNDQTRAKYVLLFGNAGSAMWEVFNRSAEYQDGQPHSLNRWSERIGREIAEKFSMQAVFPFNGPPHYPFLRWAKKAEGLQNSKLGMLIHPVFGLWHAYRFALVFSPPQNTPPPSLAGLYNRVNLVKIEQLASNTNQDICQRCKPKPCLKSCPVDAFSTHAGETSYDVQSCFRYLQSNPDSACMTQGCQARMACPHTTEYRYIPNHAAFHMRAFVHSMAETF